MNIEDLESRALEAAELLKALGNERRLLILCALGGGELSVGELAPRVGLSQSALSQHLALLRRSGLVATRRQSQTVFYRLGSPAAQAIIETLSGLYCPVKGSSRHPVN
jgi:ArsR family transcriptional regulator